MPLSSAARHVAAAALACTTIPVAFTSTVEAQSFLDQPGIRLYDFTSLDASLRSGAVEEARAIVTGAGVSAGWHDCREAPLSCAPASGDLVVRIVREPGEPPLEWRRALGYSVVNAPAGAGRLATIFINRIELAARRSGIDLRLLLGRAIAHEIGHLLLRTNTHATHGLMRAIWTEQELTRNSPADWVFAASDRRQILAALQRTSRSAAR